MPNSNKDTELIRNNLSPIKKLILFIFGKFGYGISKIRNNSEQADPVKGEIDRQQHKYEKFVDADTLSKKPFFNIGSGGFWHPHWTNIDFISDWYGKLQKDILHYDLMSLEPLPIESGTAKIIYTSHTIEHIKENAVQNLFNEAYRSLEKGGIFRIVTGPDAESDFRALMNDDEDWFYWNRYYQKVGTYEHMFIAPPTSVSLAERWLWNVATPLSLIDISPSSKKFNEKEIWDAIHEFGFPKVLDHFSGLCNYDPSRPGNHISWWTHEKIFEFLKEAGFTNIYRSGCNQSASPLMRTSSISAPIQFDSTHPQMSIFVEAVKT